MIKIINRLLASLALLNCGLVFAAEQPNIVVIFGDDIGYGNISAYNNGMLGYQTPNIDSIANEGALLTSYYAEQSCTAGRSVFITGQMPVRTGLSKVGLPGAPQGIQPQDITMAQALKDLGYATGQFGKNHLGDRDTMLPTEHGFDEFLGNLYHLNAEEEPENPDYPKSAAFKQRFGPRGVIKSTADTSHESSGLLSSKQGARVEDTGALTSKRMETIDDETLDAANDFMTRKVAEDKPFFLWYNTTRMHNYTHVSKEHSGVTGLGDYADGMVEHDNHIGNLLDKLKQLDIDDNTIVIYTTDNGPMNATWPDAATSPFRGEKATAWEGGFRVPALIKWPNHIKPGSKFNGIISSADWFPTLVSIAGNSKIKKELLTGYKSTNGRSYRNHLDGFNQVNYLTQQSDKSARNSFFYWSDDGELLAMRDGRWKFHFKIQEHKGIAVWTQAQTTLRVPKLFDLAVDPYEKGDQGFGYDNWWYKRAFLVIPAQIKVKQMMASFKDFPPRQVVGSFTVDIDMEDILKVSKQGKQ
ncbi:arylsulfatase [Shewanella sp.]|uniref:arylsulfatase n=1 Tax=Shewanella sp. TaxID=50422 RepID=UPI002587A588|nr:arylsulfatase [Shewanella sp.]MCJ8304065.1 arylsulfatase [Shewanella sp.]